MTPERARFREILAQEYQRLDRPEYAEWVLAPGELDVCDQAALAAMQRAARVPEGFTLVPNVALEWLSGAAPDHEGKWFGECEPRATHGAFWWRSHFRRIIVAASPQHCKEG